MSKDTLFNIPIEEFKRQASRQSYDYDHDLGPIRSGETLEPCIKGAKKISEDPELKEVIKEVLTHKE